jgi:hypothetical protein
MQDWPVPNSKSRQLLVEEKLPDTEILRVIIVDSGKLLVRVILCEELVVPMMIFPKLIEVGERDCALKSIPQSGKSIANTPTNTRETARAQNQ